MKTLVLALGGLSAAWMLAPVVAMSARGTIDSRTRAACRAAARTAPPSVLAIPAQRRGDLDDRVSA
ncbi:hypothetical protein ACR9E3_31080 [Actinomycetospora sp. C-140]